MTRRHLYKCFLIFYRGNVKLTCKQTYWKLNYYLKVADNSLPFISINIKPLAHFYQPLGKNRICKHAARSILFVISYNVLFVSIYVVLFTLYVIFSTKLNNSKLNYIKSYCTILSNFFVGPM